MDTDIMYDQGVIFQNIKLKTQLFTRCKKYKNKINRPTHEYHMLHVVFEKGFVLWYPCLLKL